MFGGAESAQAGTDLYIGAVVKEPLRGCGEGRDRPALWRSISRGSGTRPDIQSGPVTFINILAQHGVLPARIQPPVGSRLVIKCRKVCGERVFVLVDGKV